jgi:hypothetical protein
MYFTAASLVPYLIGRGLVDLESVSRGDVKIAELERNNRCFQVISEAGPSYFIKQIRERDEFTIASLQRETAIYQFVNEPRFAPLQTQMPKLVAFDQQRHALIVELLTDSQNVHRFHNQRDDYPVDLAKALGQSLATFHSKLGQEFADEISQDTFDAQPPWILKFHTDQGDGRLSPPNQQLLELLQADSQMQASLDYLHEVWKLDGLMHRDLKWNNIAVKSRDDGGYELKWLDWEMADRGDWCWDAGMMLQNWWSFETMAVQNAPIEAEPLLDQVLTRDNPANIAARAFWNEWSSSIELAAKLKASFIEKSVMCAAARLLQTAYELMHPATELHDNALRLFRLSQHILKNPAVAISWLKKSF